MSDQPLCQQFDTLSDLGIFKYEQKDYITSNLSERIKLRPYQEEALARFEYYFDDYKHRQWPMHLLFHMATGSGKTVVMAANILYLYKKGYRNFIFFVNATNVIEKTRANFLDPSSSKYLFAEKIVIDDRIVEIKEVENFYTDSMLLDKYNNITEAESDTINIYFTTVQGLQSRINEPRENAVTIEELKENKIVLLSDEAYHINALTKKRLNKTDLKHKTWEGTVNRVHRANRDNIMLAYTATVELNDPSVAAKYSDKIIFQYDLRKFCADKYSKEIRLLQSDAKQKQRILQALILSQYRRKVAHNSGIGLKPCMLFKSPKIADSEAAYEYFVKLIRELSEAELEKIKKNVKTSVVAEAFRYFEEHEITMTNWLSNAKKE